MLNSSEERIDWVDECKGLAIILVVFGHCWSRELLVFRWIYSFHLPIFFIIAGYLISVKNTIFTKKNIIKKIRRLLIPYFIFSFLIILMISILKILGDNFSNTYLLNEVKGVLGFNAHMSTWFLSCIFLSECIFLFVFKYIGNKKYLHIFWIVLCIIVTFRVKIDSELIFVLRRSLLGIAWMEVGVGLHQLHKKGFEISWTAIIVAFLGNIVLCINNGKVNMMLLDYGKSEIVFLIIGIIGSITIIEMFRGCKKDFRLLEFLGMHSLEILCLHSFFIEMIRLLDYKLFGNFISNRTHLEGYILTTLVLLLEIPFIWILNKYFPWIIGKQLERSDY